ncbi:MAG: serine kinase, partial [Chloroflexi bacterium]|nr:serine kinase [Chloroflexota bacterium]
MSVRLRFAGPALLADVTRALTHLATTPVREPTLTVCIWDSCSTHTPVPPPAWGLDSYRPSGEIREFTDEQFYTGFQLGASILGMVDLERGLGVYWVRSADQIPAYETAAPLRLVLYPWLHAHHTLAIHAGGVGLPEGGVLLAGSSGSGKSTTALACLDSDLLYTADDFCLVSRTR